MSKAIVGTLDDAEQLSPPPDELFLVVLDRVEKQIATELLTACIEVLERNGYAGSVNRTPSGGILLSGRKEGDDGTTPA